jgi:hypothetical protein
MACSISLKKLCNDESCEICFNKSFASCPRSKYLSKINEISPRHIFKYSKKKLTFLCFSCLHEFVMPIKNISNGQFCSFCSNVSLCIDDKCVVCYRKSFASCSMSKIWSSENNISPRNIFNYSMKKYKFDCTKCGYIFEASPGNIMRENNCGHCNNTILCDNDDHNI